MRRISDEDGLTAVKKILNQEENYDFCPPSRAGVFPASKQSDCPEIKFPSLSNVTSQGCEKQNFSMDAQHTPTAVRYTLQLLEDKAPGSSIEVRVPPYGAVQIVEGVNHRRGTPPNVIEMSSTVWLELALGYSDYKTEEAKGSISASGVHTGELANLLPVL